MSAEEVEDVAEIAVGEVAEVVVEEAEEEVKEATAKEDKAVAEVEIEVERKRRKEGTKIENPDTIRKWRELVLVQVAEVRTSARL